MKYLSFESLNYQDFIIEEETLQILFQEFQILDYLYFHFSFLTHRDIKSINILV